LRELAACVAALPLACGLAGAAHAEKRCGEEITRPLLEVLHQKDLQQTDPVAVRTAIEKLGMMRCVDVIDDLVALLTFRFPFPKEDEMVTNRRFTATRYPATNALPLIGKPALPALVKVIETNDPAALLSKNARFTVRCIFAYREKEGDEFFREAADKATTPEAKERLLRALETAREDMRAD
jgi:hypothetical protein